MRVLSDYSGNDSLSLSEQRSGNSIPDLYLSLVDIYNQTVGSDSLSTVTLEVNTTNAPTTFTPVLSGATTVVASSGLFKLSNIEFTAQPGTTYNLYFTTTGIDSTKPSNSDYLTSLNKTEPTMDLQVGLRECAEGEAFLITGECSM